MVSIASSKTILGLKFRLFIIMAAQWVGYTALVLTNFSDSLQRALGLGSAFCLALVYIALAIYLYQGRQVTKQILSIINFVLIVVSSYFPVISDLLSQRSALFTSSMLIANSDTSLRIAMGTQTFTLSRLWPTLLVLFCAAISLNILRQYTILKLWDRSIVAKQNNTDMRMSLGNTFTLALFSWLAFYSILALLPSSSRFLQGVKSLFWGSDFTYYILAFVFWWMIALIVSEYLAIHGEALNVDKLQRIFESSGFSQIRQSEAVTLISRIERSFQPVSHSSTANHIHILLKSILDGKPNEIQQISQQLETIEYQAAENARSFIFTLLGSLPMLGFLGTIIGIISAVGGFSKVISGGGDTTELTSSLNGLSVAFETTLIGLIGSLIGTYLLALVRRYSDQVDLHRTELLHQQLHMKVYKTSDNSKSTE